MQVILALAPELAGLHLGGLRESQTGSLAPLMNFFFLSILQRLQCGPYVPSCSACTLLLLLVDVSLWKASILPVVGLGFADRRDSIHVTHVLGQHMFVFHRPKKLVNIPAGVLFILVILHGSFLIHDLLLQSISISDGFILISNMRCRYLVNTQRTQFWICLV